MKTLTENKKQDLINWINQIDDDSVLNAVLTFKNQTTNVDDFKKRWEQSIKLKEAKKRSIQKINDWWQK